MIKTKFNEIEFYNQYKGKITCAYKKDVFVDKEGNTRCNAKRTQEREKYLFKELTKEMVLIECPKNILTIEFETHDKKGEKKVNKEQLKEWIKQTGENAKSHKIDYCICSHGGTSDYFYACNLQNLIENKEKECKKEIAELIVPKEAIDFIDMSNLGKTLIPIINRPHWKEKKYNGAIHKIIEGKNPNKHKNKVPNIVLQRIFDGERPNFIKREIDNESDINSISLSKVIGTAGLKKRGEEYQGVNPWHGSSTGMNFCYNPSKNIWHCFRCNTGGSVAKAIGLNQGVIKSCDEKLSSSQFKEVLEIAREKYGLKKIEKKAIKIFTSRNYQAEEFGKIQPIFYDKAGLWWLWNEKIKCWEIVDEVDILNMINDKTGQDVINSKNRAEIINSLKQFGRKKIPKPIKLTWIQFKDLIIDIKTGKKFEATPEYFVTNPIPWELHKEDYEHTPTIDKIFEEWVGKDYVQTLYEIIAYCLLPDYPLHRLFCFIGGGMNGKSCFLNLLKKFVGENNVCSTELDTLLTSRFEITRLHKKLICQMGETNFSEMNKTSILKKLTGKDIIGFEYKNKNPFEDVNYAKILIATNNLPTTTDKTIGFYRRWMIIDFPNEFSEKKDILDDIPEEEYNSLALKCCSLLKDLLKKRKFHKEGSIKDRMKTYEEKSNPLEKFLKEFTTLENPNESVPKWEFEKRLNEWLKENRFRNMSEQSIGKSLREHGIEDGRVYVEWWENDVQTRKQVRAWMGIQWLANKTDKTKKTGVLT